MVYYYRPCNVDELHKLNTSVLQHSCFVLKYPKNTYTGIFEVIVIHNFRRNKSWVYQFTRVIYTKLCMLCDGKYCWIIIFLNKVIIKKEIIIGGEYFTCFIQFVMYASSISLW